MKNPRSVKISDYQNDKYDETMINKDGMLVRFCHQCKMIIDFEGFVSANNNMEIQELTMIWMDTHVKLYCCHCLKEIKKREKFVDVRY